MRKKIAVIMIFVLISLVALPFSSALAAPPAGLLRGVASDEGRTNLTDGSDTSNESLSSPINYTLEQVHNITGYYYKALDNYSEIAFFNSSGAQITVKNPTNMGSSGSAYTALVVEGVKRIQVRSKPGWGSSGYEIDVQGAPVDAIPPEQPTGLNANAFDGSVSLSWSANSEPDLAGYNVYQDGTKINGSLITGTSYTATTSNNQTYTFTITAEDEYGNESVESTPVTTHYDTISPIAPVGLVSSPDGSGQTVLTWSPNTEPDLAGYNVYQDGTKHNASLIPTESYTVTGLLENTSYSFTITAVDLSDNESGQSSAVTYFWDDTPPAKPTGFTAAAGFETVSLSWSPNSDTDLSGYNLYRDGIKVNGTLITTPSYTDNGLANEVEYSYQITAVDGHGNESEKSAIVKVTPTDTDAPDAPSGLSGSLSADYTEVNLTWSASLADDTDGYNVYQSFNGTTFGKVNSSLITGTSYDVTSLLENSKVYYAVTSVDSNGNESSRSTLVEVDIPARTPTTTVTHDVYSMTIDWTPIDGATEYLIYFNDEHLDTVTSDVNTYTITSEQGYESGKLFYDYEVITRFADGSLSRDLSGGWGFTPGDVFSNSMWIVASLSGFILMGLVIYFTPQLVMLIKLAASGDRTGFKMYLDKISFDVKHRLKGWKI